MLTKKFALKNNALFLFFFLLTLNKVNAQNVGINATGSAPNNSAMLDVDAGNKGLLIPRVSLLSNTDVITIPSPATSLLVYNINIGMIGGGIGFFYWNGAIWSTFGTTSSVTISVQTFITSGIYVPTIGIKYAIVHMVGGGAGGWNAGSGNFGGGGGGSGEYATDVFSAVTIGGSQVITIGTGGLPNAAGGTTSFGTLLSAAGAPVSNQFYGGAGGTGGTGTGLHVHGGSGYNGIIQTFAGPVYNLHGGNGGTSFFGGGGRGGTGLVDVGQPGLAYGSGGGGNGYSSNTWGLTAGAGASGIIIVYEYK